MLPVQLGHFSSQRDIANEFLHGLYGRLHGRENHRLEQGRTWRDVGFCIVTCQPTILFPTKKINSGKVKQNSPITAGAKALIRICSFSNPRASFAKYFNIR